MASIATHDLTLSYQRQVIIDSLNLQLPENKVTVLIGSNGCGKSTLLKSLARLLKPQQGTVVLNGADIHQKSTATVARELAILP
ncbi:ABC transporter ATP-binding protein, partial [Pseudomonas coronafaciens]